LLILVLTEHCFGHDISIFDVGTRITMWVMREKLQLGFLVELKNFPAQDERKNCDLNKDMTIDEDERLYYIKERCKLYIDKLHVKINGQEVPKVITKTEVFGIIGDVDRGPFSTYMEIDVPVDQSFYKVKIEFYNENFENEEPQIINDVNISVNRELDNLNIYPITPLVQYLDRELLDHMFMEMTLKRRFFVEYGYKEIEAKQEPFAANDIMLTKKSGETARKIKAGTPAPGASANTTTSQNLYKWLNNFTMNQVAGAIKAKGAWYWLWLIIIGVFVGLIHVILPGHGKGVIASFVVATHAGFRDAIKLSLLVTLVHTISTTVLTAFIMVLAGQLLTTTVQNVAVVYLTLLSGLLISIIGVYMLFFFKAAQLYKEEEEEKEFVTETLADATDRKPRFPLMWKVAVATGIIPCITSSYAATIFIFYREYTKAFLMILFIAIGQAITLSIIGAAFSGGFHVLRKVALKKESGLLMWIVSRLHRPTAVVLIIVGVSTLWLGYQWKTATSSLAVPMTAEQRVEAYKNIVERNPDDFDANFNLGLLYAARGDIEKAEKHLERASAAKPDDLDSLRFRGHALARLGKQEEALGTYQSALKLAADDANLLFNIAYVEQALDRQDEAVKHYKQAIAANPDDPKVSFNLGLIYSKQSKLDKALECFAAAVKLRAEDPSIHMAVARTCHSKKLYREAVEHLLQARKKNPLSREVNLALANIYIRRLDEPENAKPYVDAYLEAGGRDEIDQALKELEGAKVEAHMYMKWRGPEVVKKFEKLGVCAASCLIEHADKQQGEELKTALAAINATETPQAIPCLLSVLTDKNRWVESDLYVDYGPDMEPPPIPVIAKKAFESCMRGSCIEAVVRELVKVVDPKNNREYFLKELFYSGCNNYPVRFMESLLAMMETAGDEELKGVVSLALALKGEALSMAGDPETARAFASYVTSWWKKNKDQLKWDKMNHYFTKKEDE